MAIVPFLAMTAAEMRSCSVFPEKIAWMACHFSPYGLGLSNLPKNLPAGSVLMVDDVTPPHGHNPVLIAEQLSMCVESLQCCGVLLDFQRPGCEESATLVKHLLQALPCPTVVSECYAGDVTCPILLPPPAPSVPLQEHLAPWQDREIWLELGLNGELITLTEQGCQVFALPYPGQELAGFEDGALHCHYSIQASKISASFTLWRTSEDLDTLVQMSEIWGVKTFVGLYQELK